MPIRPKEIRRPSSGEEGPRVRSMIDRLIRSARVIALALLVASCNAPPSSPTSLPEPAGADQPTYLVQRGEVIEATSFSGQVLPLVQEYLIARKDGRISNLYVRSGDAIQAGQILADMEGLDALQQQKELNALNIQRAQTEAEIAQLSLDLFIQQTPTYTAGYREQLAIKQRELALAQIEVSEAQLQTAELDRMIQESLIISPLSGQVRFLDIGVGDDVQAYDLVGIVAEVNDLELGAELPKEILSQLAEGMPVTVRPSHLPDTTLTGLIRQLPPPYGNNPSISRRSPAETFAWFQLDVDLATTGMVLDEVVTIDVVLQRSEDALWLPPEAVRTFEDQDFVIILDNGFQQRVDILIGLRSPDRVEILEGLSEGQQVLGP